MALRLYSAMPFSWEVGVGGGGGINLWQSTDWKKWKSGGWGINLWQSTDWKKWKRKVIILHVYVLL